ncbi:uncharacterized protein A4U43_C03F13880 [Asparagus officinalis]|uniref:FYVE-type domain-containing protein n=1 Tax=Asparagus officinalis TaxID=4686 RepID=A0A5P1FF15_ASPOF|nr:uncharacterized protein LOC109833649 [Asparagus officinalis]ONK75150.1 uncharacterized protein A4U43_C03F13880 [Asparagus officinalis]
MSSYSSLARLVSQGCYGDNFIAFQSDPAQSSCSSGQGTWKQNHLYQLPGNSNLYDDSDTAEDLYISPQPPAKPEVNLKNVLSGIVAILTGSNKGLGTMLPEQESDSTVEFLGPEVNGVSSLHSSVCAPSAPPLTEEDAINYTVYRDLLVADPPEWLPDSCTKVCMQCNSPFTALTRGRHHCRFCGHIFCRACSKGRCLLPAKFRLQDPQRVCDACYDRLQPVQETLKHFISNAAQSAKHDVMDWTCTRGWLNLPIGLSMEHEIYKAANTLTNYCQVARLNPEKSIPQAVLKGASGLAILTVAKVGALLTYKLGTGLVVYRRSDGSWSAPSAILSAGLGWGAQIGGELMDFIIVLHGYETVKTFCSRMHFSLGAGLSVAAGPVGRVFEADFRSGDRGSGLCYTYSCSKGAFIGVSLEGSIVTTRMDTNLMFYGDPYMTTADILLGTVQRPIAAQPLYSALDNLYSNLGC